MRDQLKFLFAAALIGCASILAAQETAPETPAQTPAETPAQTPAETPAETPATDAAADLSLGTPVDEVIAVGQQYIRETFGDWSLRCLRAAEGADPCQLYQLLEDADGNAVAEISLFPLPAGGQAAAGATIVAPLETLLTEQLTIAVDGSTPRRYPFTFCNMGGCVARVGFTEAEVTQFKRGARATLRLVPAAAPDQDVTLEISLLGFTAGYDSPGREGAQ